MGRRLLLLALATALVPSALAADSVTRTSFADGNWTGAGRYRQLIQTAQINGNATISMKVRAKRVTGVMSLVGTISGPVQGTQATANITGRYPLAGSASAPVGRGPLRVSTVIDGKRQAGSAPVVVALTGLRGICDRMSGKIVFRSPKPDPNATGPQSISMAFTASRVKGSGPRC